MAANSPERLLRHRNLMRRQRTNRARRGDGIPVELVDAKAPFLQPGDVAMIFREAAQKPSRSTRPPGASD